MPYPIAKPIIAPSFKNMTVRFSSFHEPSYWVFESLRILGVDPQTRFKLYHHARLFANICLAQTTCYCSALLELRLARSRLSPAKRNHFY